MNYKILIDQLKKHNVLFEDGLIQSEFDYIENEFKIIFPPDLRDFLSIALPISNNFVNWRNQTKSNVKSITERLKWPLEGLLFDIENNSFWYDTWGERPESLEDALMICREEFEIIPKLIPIYSHRYIPMEPCENNNPIFSVYQSDIIYYGKNLYSYFENEFYLIHQTSIDIEKIKRTKFWSDLVDSNR